MCVTFHLCFPSRLWVCGRQGLWQFHLYKVFSNTFLPLCVLNIRWVSVDLNVLETRLEAYRFSWFRLTKPSWECHSVQWQARGLRHVFWVTWKTSNTGNTSCLQGKLSWPCFPLQLLVRIEPFFLRLSSYWKCLFLTAWCFPTSLSSVVETEPCCAQVIRVLILPLHVTAIKMTCSLLLRKSPN